MKKTLLFLTIIILTPILSIGQNKKPKRGNGISQVASLRDNILKKHPESLKELGALYERWDSIASVEEAKYMTFNILKARVVDGSKHKHIRREAIKAKPASLIAKELTDAEIEIIAENSEILDLIHFGLLEHKYPFKLNGTSNFYKEFAFYDIKENDSILEIGSGFGTLGLMINLMMPKVNLYLNELDESYLKYIESRIYKNPELFNAYKIALLKGAKKSTNLEHLEVDKIILRNTYHHFSHKEEMINSIKKTLKKNGYLFLLESTIELNSDDDLCEKAMKKEEVLSEMLEQGFNLVAEEKWGETAALKFQINALE